MTSKASNGGAVPVTRKPSAPRRQVPPFDLEASIKVAEAIRNRGGGKTDREHLATFLNYSTIRSGGFNMRLAAARLFGVIEGRGDDLSIAELGERIVAPRNPDQAREARVEAFLNVPVFRSTYEHFRGKQLPPHAGLQNYLQTEPFPDLRRRKCFES